MESVRAIPAALPLIARLCAAHGAVCFYQSQGCCDGVPFHASRAKGEYLLGMALTRDVAAGDAETLLREDGSGQHFVLRMRLWSDEEGAPLRPLRRSMQM